MKRAWIGFLLAIVLTGAANADDRCSVATLQGSYGFALSGTLTGGLPTVTIGVITFDGNGNASDTGTNSRNGVSRVLPPGTGTYSVDSDCIVTTTLGSGATAAHWTEVIGAGGNEVRPMRVDPVAVVTGVDLRMQGEVCTNEILSGSYAFSGNGTLIGTGPVAFNGVMNFDGITNFTAFEVQNANGTATRKTYAGTYSVNSDCSFQATLLDSPTRHITGVLDDGGRRFRFMHTDDGVTDLASAVAQFPARRNDDAIDNDRRQ